jgi:hypothetical protein
MDEVKRLQDALYREKDDLENQRKLVQTFKSESKMHQSETEEMKRNQVCLASFSFISMLQYLISDSMMS